MARIRHGRVEDHAADAVDADVGRAQLGRRVVGVGSAGNGDPVRGAVRADDAALRGIAAGNAEGHGRGIHYGKGKIIITTTNLNGNGGILTWATEFGYKGPKIQSPELKR